MIIDCASLLNPEGRVLTSERLSRYVCVLMKTLVHLVLDLATPWVTLPALRQGQQGLLLHLPEQLCDGSIVQLLLLWTQLGG